MNKIKKNYTYVNKIYALAHEFEESAFWNEICGSYATSKAEQKISKLLLKLTKRIENQYKKN